MPSPPRSRKIGRAVRKAVKWGGLVVTMLLLVVWIGSGWCQARYVCGPTLVVFASGGQAGYLHSPNVNPTGAPVRPFILIGFFHVDWGFMWRAVGSGWIAAVPLWLPALLSLLATAAAWRADLKYLRRARAGMCPACGYDRAGLAAGVVCPECGAAASVQNHPAGA